MAASWLAMYVLRSTAVALSESLHSCSTVLTQHARHAKSPLGFWHCMALCIRDKPVVEGEVGDGGSTDGKPAMGPCLVEQLQAESSGPACMWPKNGMLLYIRKTLPSQLALSALWSSN